MARFYGEVKGAAATTASRIGHEMMTAHIRGWNLGAKITISVNEKGQDELVIQVTGGSNNPESGNVIYHDSTKDDGKLLAVGSEIRIVLAPKGNINLNQND